MLKRELCWSASTPWSGGSEEGILKSFYVAEENVSNGNVNLCWSLDAREREKKEKEK